MNRRLRTFDGLQSPSGSSSPDSRLHFGRAVKRAALPLPFALVHSRNSPRFTEGLKANRLPPRIVPIVTATLEETELRVSDRKQTTGPLCDRNTLPYFYFRPAFASHPPNANQTVPAASVQRLTSCLQLLIPNRNYYGLEIDLNCCKQSPLIFSNEIMYLTQKRAHVRISSWNGYQSGEQPSWRA